MNTACTAFKPFTGFFFALVFRAQSFSLGVFFFLPLPSRDPRTLTFFISRTSQTTSQTFFGVMPERPSPFFLFINRSERSANTMVSQRQISSEESAITRSVRKGMKEVEVERGRSFAVKGFGGAVTTYFLGANPLSEEDEPRSAPSLELIAARVFLFRLFIFCCPVCFSPSLSLS